MTVPPCRPVAPVTSTILPELTMVHVFLFNQAQLREYRIAKFFSFLSKNLWRTETYFLSEKIAFTLKSIFAQQSRLQHFRHWYSGTALLAGYSTATVRERLN